MNPNLLTDSYIEYIKVQKRYSSRTQVLYGDVLMRYYLYIYGMEKVEDIDAIIEGEVKKGAFRLAELLQTRHIRNYVVYCIKGGMGARSVNLHLSALSGYCRWLVSKGILNGNPVKGVPRPKEKRRLPHFYDRDSLDEYCSMNLPDKYSQMRNRLIVMLLYATGIRRQELADLKLKDVDLDRKVLKVTGKGDKQREIPVIPELCEKFLLYLQKRKEEFGTDTCDSFFLTDKGAPLYLKFVNDTVRKELAGLKGFEGKVSPPTKSVPRPPLCC